MKNLFKLPVLVLGLILLLAGTTQKAMAQDDDVSLQTFYDELSPYGTWIQDSEYGYVWRPDVDQADFRPYYSDGRWVMTEYGNTWVSDYDWGWAPFHYGRWVNNRYNEWVWIPDTTWGPAWVSWRSGGGYYGWAPLGPGINININLGGGYRIPNSWWVFVPERNIYYDRFPSYRSYRNMNIINHTTIINYTGTRGRHTYFTGPRRDDIRRATSRDVTVYRVNRTDRSGRSSITNNTVNIYNPRSRSNTDNQNAAPRRVSSEGAYTTSRNNSTNGNSQSRTNRADVSTRANPADRTSGRTTDRSTNVQRNNAENNRATGVTSGRTNRQYDATAPANQRSDAAQRSQRVQSQGQVQQREQSSRQQQTEAQQQERVQRQAQVREQQVQRQEQSRQQQAQPQQQEQANRQQEAQAQQQQRAQRQAQESSARQQQQQQQQQREQSSARQEVQQERQPRVQQSSPSRSSESRSQAPGSSRSSRGSRD